MQIYSLITQKGGAGKSTLTRRLAVLAGETEPSLIIDRDPQRTTTKWWTRREQIEPAFKRPELIDLDGTTLTDAVTRLRRKPEGALFIDTRPAVEESEAEAARVADLVIVPVRPSPIVPGTFTATDDGFIGTLATLTLKIKDVHASAQTAGERLHRAAARGERRRRCGDVRQSADRAGFRRNDEGGGTQSDRRDRRRLQPRADARPDLSQGRHPLRQHRAQRRASRAPARQRRDACARQQRRRL